MEAARVRWRGGEAIIKSFASKPDVVLRMSIRSESRAMQDVQMDGIIGMVLRMSPAGYLIMSMMDASSHIALGLLS